MRTKQNPYRAARLAFEKLSAALMVAFLLGIVALFTAALWQAGWGAWSLLWPFIVGAGIAVVVGIGYLIHLVLVWLHRRENEWAEQ